MSYSVFDKWTNNFQMIQQPAYTTTNLRRLNVSYITFSCFCGKRNTNRLVTMCWATALTRSIYFNSVIPSAPVNHCVYWCIILLILRILQTVLYLLIPIQRVHSSQFFTYMRHVRKVLSLCYWIIRNFFSIIFPDITMNFSYWMSFWRQASRFPCRTRFIQSDFVYKQCRWLATEFNSVTTSTPWQ